MSMQSVQVAIGERVPIDIPEDIDGTPLSIPKILCPWPLEIVLPADIGPAHEQALMAATPDGKIRRLICLQAHQRRLESKADPEQQSYLPLIQCSLYLRGPSGPMHRPLHWLAFTDVLGYGQPHQDELLVVMKQLAQQPSKGMPARLVITGRDGRLLMVSSTAMHNAVAMVWARALHLAVSGASLHPSDFVDMVTQAEADLMPVVERQGCMRELMPVAIGGQHRTVRGDKLTSWLLRHGWLHPKQVACEDADGGAA